jgi:hypothetical protein
MEQDIFVNLGASLCTFVYSYSTKLHKVDTKLHKGK